VNGRMAGLNVEVKEECHNHRMNPFYMNRKNILYRHLLNGTSDGMNFQKVYDMTGQELIPMKK